MQVTSPVVPPLIIKGMTPLSPVFENLLNKKVNKIALNIFERLIDALCSFFYKTYTDRQNFKLTARYFQDGAMLIDRTSKQRVKVKPSESFNLLTQKTIKGSDEIYVDGCRVYFHPNPNVQVLFGKKYNTAHAIATDVDACPELVMVYERETTNDLKVWCVDTRKPTDEFTMGGQLIIGQSKKVFIAQPIGNLPVPLPIHRSMFVPVPLPPP